MNTTINDTKAQVIYLRRVAFRAGFQVDRHGDLTAMLIANPALFQRAAERWRRHHPVENTHEN